MATKKNPAPATFKANGETYTPSFGIAAMIAIEKELGVPLSGLGESLKKPSMAMVRDLFAAALIQHHPAHSAASAILGGVIAQTGGNRSQAVDWAGQQALANDLLDAIGVGKAADLIGAAVEASPHMSEAAPA